MVRRRSRRRRQARHQELPAALATLMPRPATARQYISASTAALEATSRPGWRAEYDQTTRDIAAQRGRDLDGVLKAPGLHRRRRRWTMVRRGRSRHSRGMA